MPGFANQLIGDPFFLGSSSSSEVPGVYMAALNGRGYMLDETKQWGRESIGLLRQQADSGDRPAERSINPEDLWRRAAETWHLGSGQSRFDRDESAPGRYRDSKGVDPWTKWQLSLLHDTTHLSTTSSTNLALAATSTRLFWVDGTAIKYTDNLAAVTSMTGTHNWVSITSNGYDVWATDGADIYNWARTATSTGSSWSATNADLLVWVRGKARLMAAQGVNVYNVVGATALTSTDSIAPDIISTDFTWVGFSEGPAAIYGAGYQGDKSLVFRWGVKADGSGLDEAVPALPDGLPDGEIIRSIGAYLGFVLLGSDRGVRFCQPDGNGDLTLGALIRTPAAVRCFEGQDRFVWYGLTNYDADSTGLGRLDLLSDTGQSSVPTPAYASDLMASAQGNVLSVATFADKRVFAVSASGIWVEDTDLVEDGTVESGTIDFGLPDNKVAMFLDVRHTTVPGMIGADVAVDGGVAEALGATDTAAASSALFPVGQRTGTRFETIIRLERSAVDATVGPTLTRWTLLANPAPRRRSRWVLPFLLYEDQLNRAGGFGRRSPAEELQRIVQLWQSQTPVRLQVGNGFTATVTVEDWNFRPDKSTTNQPVDFYDGVCSVTLKELT